MFIPVCQFRNAVVKQAVLHAEGITRPITRYGYVAVLRTMGICIVPLDERAMSMHLPKCYQLLMYCWS